MGGRTLAALLLLAGPATAAAQETDEAAAMRGFEAAVPRQDWYPEGYYDIRIAAEAEMAEVIASPAADRPETPGGDHNLIACDARKLSSSAADPLLERYGDTALETARLRAQLGRLGYPAGVAASPLLAFERARIAVDGGGKGSGDPYEVLAEALNAARASTPALPEVFAFDECRPPPAAAPSPAPGRPAVAAVRPRRTAGVTFVTQPSAGELLMIDAFAFKVCTRKQSDPWDRFQCRWNEIETGVAKPMSGRFVYQVKWPDGTIRKGTREVAPGPGGAATVTFRKTGS
ncbi:MULTISPECIES: hypothetical protein [unclassified Sphingopyxis]|uniref:hypothetical protein n=1 Tax=unclassified Sphingopyxis TaxID=2614943 RepID=UPI000736BF21|nr:MULTISPECIES: hypothetical protein [unclassified Sphingopyxis]KTE40049.1 hypothetical protein ATE62_08065 [Sphingopyxis sp. HIX]KTE85991.1 hypothetical protein ATE72_00030 [Sphingopyxis sp. HXXIV]